MAVAVRDKRDLTDRLSNLYSFVFDDKPWEDASLNLEALLDALVAVQRECANLSLDYLSKFGSKYSRVVDWVRSLRVNADDFEVLTILAKGGYGKVFLVRSRIDGELYAMKTLKKADVLKTENVYFFEERNIMAFSQGAQWLTALKAAFQDDDFLYLVMDYFPGGDLVTLLENQEDAVLDEEWARFYIAETVLAIEELHAMEFIHRDIKPHNLLIDRTGHLKLADFGSCIHVGASKTVNSNVSVGTPDYISPEVLRAQEGNSNYGKEVDWWSTGIVMYETLFGDPPFYAESITATYSMIMNHKLNLKFPQDSRVSEEAKDLVQKLLADSKTRLGKNGAEEVKSHPWFRSINWDRLRQSKAPFIPSLNSADDTSYFPEVDDDEIEIDMSKHQNKPRNFVGHHLPFIGYTFYREATLNARQRFREWQQEAKPVQAAVSSLPSPQASLPRVLSDSNIRAYVAKVEVLEDELARAKGQVDEKDHRIGKLEKLNGNLQQELGETTSRLDAALQKDKLRLEAEKAKLMVDVELQESRAQLLQVTRENQELRKELDNANSAEAKSFRAHQESRRLLEEQNKKLESRINRLQEDLRQQKQELMLSGDTDDRVAELERDAEDTRQQLIEALHNYEDMSSQMTNNEAQFRSQVQALEKEKCALQTENERLTARVAALTDNLQSERHKLQRASQANLEMDERRSMRDLEIKSLESQLKLATNERDELHARLKDGTLRRSGDQDVQTLQASLEEQSELRRNLLQELSGLIQEKNVMELELGKIKKQLEREVESHAETKEENKELSRQCQDGQNLHKALRAKFEKYQSENIRLGTKVVEIEERYNMEATKRRSAEELVSLTRSELGGSLEKMRMSLEKERAHRAEMTKKVENLVATAESEGLARRSAESLLNEANQANEELLASQKRESSELGKLRQRNDELESQCVDLKKSLAILQLDIQTERKIQQDATTELEDIRSRFEQVENEHTSTKSLLAREMSHSSNLQKELAGLRETLRMREDELIELSRKLNTDPSDRPSKRLRQEVKDLTVRLEQANARIQVLQERLVEIQKSQSMQATASPDTCGRMGPGHYFAEGAEFRHGEGDISRPSNNYSLQKVGRRSSLLGLLPRLSRPGSLSELKDANGERSPEIRGILKIPKDPRSLRRGWKKRFLVLKDGSLVVYQKDANTHAEETGVPLVNLKNDLFMARATQPQELFHLPNKDVECTFIILVSPRAHAVPSPVQPSSAFPHASQSRAPEMTKSHVPGSTNGEMGKRIEWLQKRLHVEERVKQGAENYLKVAPRSKLSAAQKQVEAANERLKGYRIELERLQLLKDDSASTKSLDSSSFHSLNHSRSTEVDTLIDNLERQIRAERSFMEGAKRIASVSRRPTSAVADKEIVASQERLVALEDQLHRARQGRGSAPSMVEDKSTFEGSSSHSRTPSTIYSEDTCGHTLRQVHSNIPNTCFVCHETVWGPQGQGLECTVCRLIMHRICLKDAHLNCYDASTLQSSDPMYFMASDPEERKRWLHALNASRATLESRRSQAPNLSASGSGHLQHVPPAIVEEDMTPRKTRRQNPPSQSSIVTSPTRRPLPRIPGTGNASQEVHVPDNRAALGRV